MRKIEDLLILRERVCLDFVNTVGDHLKESIYQEYLTSYSAFVQWCHRRGIINSEQADFFLAESKKRDLEAVAVFQRVHQLREALFRIFFAVAAQDSPEEKDLEILNGEIDRVLPRLKLKYLDQGFIWTNTGERKALDWMLSIIVQDIIDLLLSDKLARVKICRGDNCGWIFLDMSKNRSRRWCSMQECGNRAKARRHYSKKTKPSDKI